MGLASLQGLAAAAGGARAARHGAGNCRPWTALAILAILAQAAATRAAAAAAAASAMGCLAPAPRLVANRAAAAAADGAHVARRRPRGLAAGVAAAAAAAAAVPATAGATDAAVAVDTVGPAAVAAAAAAAAADRAVVAFWSIVAAAAAAVEAAIPVTGSAWRGPINIRRLCVRRGAWGIAAHIVISPRVGLAIARRSCAPVSAAAAAGRARLPAREVAAAERFASFIGGAWNSSKFQQRYFSKVHKGRHFCGCI